MTNRREKGGEDVFRNDRNNINDFLKIDNYGINYSYFMTYVIITIYFIGRTGRWLGYD